MEVVIKYLEQKISQLQIEIAGRKLRINLYPSVELVKKGEKYIKHLEHESDDFKKALDIIKKNSIENIKFEVLDGEAGVLLTEILEIEPKCHSCGEKITKNNFGGIMPKPTRVFCKNICCVIENIPDQI